MIYLKAAAVGIFVALIFAVVWVWAAIQLPIWWQLWEQRNQGGGGAGAFVGSGSVLLVAVIGFALGFLWFIRRAQRS